uniref:Uncharacterized protein n=1 Tax=Arundo donax TaxID=35708 RepID=A0A0A8YNK2_ARUDO
MPTYNSNKQIQRYLQRLKH